MFAIRIVRHLLQVLLVAEKVTTTNDGVTAGGLDEHLRRVRAMRADEGPARDIRASPLGLDLSAGESE